MFTLTSCLRWWQRGPSAKTLKYKLGIEILNRQENALWYQETTICPGRDPPSVSIFHALPVAKTMLAHICFICWMMGRGPLDRQWGVEGNSWSGYCGLLATTLLIRTESIQPQGQGSLLNSLDLYKEFCPWIQQGHSPAYHLENPSLSFLSHFNLYSLVKKE